MKSIWAVDVLLGGMVRRKSLTSLRRSWRVRGRDSLRWSDSMVSLSQEERADIRRSRCWRSKLATIRRVSGGLDWV